MLSAKEIVNDFTVPDCALTLWIYVFHNMQHYCVKNKPTIHFLNEKRTILAHVLFYENYKASLTCREREYEVPVLLRRAPAGF